ncbi:MAG: type II toxin-antitoxin system YafQ family toxin [Candidatus Margulisbacteria bacterium]|jgi:mRNA interferase YafQ|nr:type II toxin-antitoxin system YafQ family toxin [Candidatus Margulisiibacteriota bacterium]
MLEIIYKNSFLKDWKKLKKRGYAYDKLESLLNLIVGQQPLPEKQRLHTLKGVWSGYKECHIEPDWLLIYMETAANIILVRTGTHSDLF